MIDFNGMSTRLGLFMPGDYRVTFIVRFYLHFLCSCFLRVFLTRPYQMRIIFKQLFDQLMGPKRYFHSKSRVFDRK